MHLFYLPVTFPDYILHIKSSSSILRSYANNFIGIFYISMNITCNFYCRSLGVYKYIGFKYVVPLIKHVKSITSKVSLFMTICTIVFVSDYILTTSVNRTFDCIIETNHTLFQLWLLSFSQPPYEMPLAKSITAYKISPP